MPDIQGIKIAIVPPNNRITKVALCKTVFANLLASSFWFCVFNEVKSGMNAAESALETNIVKTKSGIIKDAL